MDESVSVSAAGSLAGLSQGIRPGNRRVARFYDCAFPLYPLVDLCCGGGRRRLIAEINRYPAGRLLEIGVGPGRHIPFYRGHAVTAVDCSAAMVASCQRVAPEVETLVMDGEELAFSAECFDYVVLCHVLSVTTDARRLLAEVYRVLRPGGRVFVLNHETPMSPWRHLDRLAVPVAKWLRFHSWFRLGGVAGVERFRCTRLGIRGCVGLMRAHLLEK